jgi:hypothetical protein
VTSAIIKSDAHTGRTGAMVADMSISPLEYFSFMNIIDKIIMDVGMFICKNVFHYDAEQACNAILAKPFNLERREYILAMYS